MSVQIQSIERAAAVLRLLTGHSRPQAPTQLASELQLPKGTVYGILRTLQAVGFVEQDTESGKYQLGAALLPIGSSYLNGNELRRRALGRAHALAADTGENVRIGTRHENHVLVVHHFWHPAYPGDSATCSASSTIILSASAA
jgi:DNA-binding IclR family transcriptional regulator